MRNPLAQRLAAAGFVLAAVFAFAGEAVAAQCGSYLSRREIQAAVAEGKIRPLAEILAKAGVREKPLSPPQVCEIGGEAYYLVNVMDSYGESQSLVLNARTGSQ